MRIAVANWTSRIAGGVETYLGSILPALRRHGHDVYFWHETDGPGDRPRINGINETESACASAGPDESLQALERWRPDVLFVHHVRDTACEASLLDVAPAVLFAHDYNRTCISGTKTFRLPSLQPCARAFGPVCLLNYFPRRCGGLSPRTMAREYMKQASRLRLLRRYESVAAFSEHMCREYLNHGVPSDRVHRLPPIDTNDFANSNSAARADQPLQLAFIGRMDRLKGCSVLLDALAGVRRAVNGRVVLTLAGDGPDLERCRAKALRVVAALKDVEVVFLGWTSQQGCAELLDRAHVLVVPSVWPEPYGLVGIEARRRGVPVAAFRVGGIPEWLEDGRAGALAPADPPTSEGLAAAIVRCATSDEIRTAVRTRAQTEHDAFSSDRHLETLVPLLAGAAARQ